LQSVITIWQLAIVVKKKITEEFAESPSSQTQETGGTATTGRHGSVFSGGSLRPGKHFVDLDGFRVEW
jgi:hypothetical protein